MKTITLVLFIIIFVNELSLAGYNYSLAQDDTVYISEVIQPPEIDGYGNDNCWENAEWQSIDQVWIPYGETVSPADFSGRYKVLWSSVENLLYFIVEIDDDVISDAYVPGETAAIYNFDMIEVFIDENKSGGYHVFDGIADNESSLGVNAENAFAYHIFTKFPVSGETTSTFRAEDLAGSSWANAEHPLYNDHFPEYVVSREGTVNTWEFSLIVYDDTYDVSNVEGSRVNLSVNKVMGLSLAFNDDDEPEIDPTATERDNFFGSVAVAEAAYNDHWKNANDFGPVKLIGVPLSTDKNTNTQSELRIVPNPVTESFRMVFNNDYNGDMNISIINNHGQVMEDIVQHKDSRVFDQIISASLVPGLYFLHVSTSKEFLTHRFVVVL